MPFKTFNNWLFDGRRDTPIPRPTYDENGKIKTPDILKYNSPITHTFVVSLFLRNGPLNHYLDKYFNDINLRYLTREELLYFIKKCVYDFKIQKRDIMFYKRRQQIILYNILRERLPYLKNDDIMLFCEIIERSDNREAIYDSLGLEKPKKTKLKKVKKIKSKKISVKDFLNENFSTIEVS